MNDFVGYPEHWPVYRNPSVICDMLQGPCACGAWHTLDEWKDRINWKEIFKNNEKTATKPNII